MPEKIRQIRKLAAIMFTDMVGYSALTQQNETLALELLEEHRRILRPLFPKHNGKEIETAGDSFFVEFTSALDAARCAIQIQTMLHERNVSVSRERQIRLRIGLHLGDVVHQGKHVHGDGVNIAARIEPCALPESICVSEDVARQIENKIELRLLPLPKQELKNIRLSVAIFRIEMPWEGNAPTHAGFAKPRKNVLIGTVSLAAVAVITAALFLFTSKSEDNLSIVVLPFENYGSDERNEYFSDGFTDEVTRQLSQIAGLRVISRTSAMIYKGSNKKKAPEIGKELNVGSVLEGSVRKEGSDVRVSVQLINATNDSPLWTETYDEKMTGIFAIHSKIAQRIVNTLKTKISPAEKELLGKKSTENLEAYDFYMKGRYYWNKRLPDKLEKGIEQFKQAIALDSSYALAYAGLADSYTIIGNFNLLPPKQTYPEAKAAALKALAIDNSLAEAHASLGFALMNYDWEWSKAEKELKEAIALNPNYATARSWYAFLLTVMGRFEEAAHVREKALESDPLSPVINTDVGMTLYFARKYDLAIEQFKKTLQIDPTFPLPYVPLGGAYVQKKMYKEAVAAYQNFTMGLALARLSHPIPVAALGHVYAVSGRTEDAQNYLELVQEMSDRQYVAPYWMGVLNAGLGKRDAALTWLEKAFEDHDASMVYLKVDPVFDGIRSEPRFINLLKKMKFI